MFSTVDGMPGASGIDLYAINDAGQIVGVRWTGSSRHAVREGRSNGRRHRQGWRLLHASPRHQRRGPGSWRLRRRGAGAAACAVTAASSGIRALSRNRRSQGDRDGGLPGSTRPGRSSGCSGAPAAFPTAFWSQGAFHRHRCARSNLDRSVRNQRRGPDRRAVPGCDNEDARIPQDAGTFTPIEVPGAGTRARTESTTPAGSSATSRRVEPRERRTGSWRRRTNGGATKRPPGVDGAVGGWQ